MNSRCPSGKRRDGRKPNLAPFTRGELALKLEPLLRKQSHQGARTDLLQNSAKSSPPPLDTRAELAKVAGLSHDTMAKIKLVADRDENVCRLDFSVLEALSIGAALEALERPRAEANSIANLKRGKQKPEPENCRVGDTRDVIGAAVGMSGKTYEAAKAVVAAEQKLTPR